MNRLLKLTEQELKEEFIKYFGEEKWNKENMLSNLWPLQLAICKYLNIDPIPVVVEEIEEDSRYYIKEDYIAISNKLIMDEIEAVKCLLHELRHAQQFKCITDEESTHPFKEIWIAELIYEAGGISQEEQLGLMIEIDAYAYQKLMMKKLFDIDWHYPNEEYDKVIDSYVEKYLK